MSKTEGGGQTPLEQRKGRPKWSQKDELHLRPSSGCYLQSQLAEGGVLVRKQQED